MGFKSGFKVLKYVKPKDTVIVGKGLCHFLNKESSQKLYDNKGVCECVRACACVCASRNSSGIFSKLENVYPEITKLRIIMR